jgi:dTDP-4-dehydrorhamnose reductase
MSRLLVEGHFSGATNYEVGVILVTGASGLLGSSVLLRCREAGREVTGTYHSLPLVVPGIPTFEIDLTDELSTRSVVMQLRPSTIIHCAAATAVDWCEDHPIETQRINVETSGTLAALAATLGANFVYVSTDSVFDGTRGSYLETDQPHPLNVYAISKLEGEREVLKRKPDALIARVNLYGWSPGKKPSLAEWILAHLRDGKTVPGFVDVMFCPALASDIAGTILEMADRQLSGVYHVTGAEASSKYEFARALASIFGLDAGMVVPTRVREASLRAPRPHNVSLNTTKVQSALGHAMPTMLDGIQRFKRLEENGYTQRLREFTSEAVA